MKIKYNGKTKEIEKNLKVSEALKEEKENNTNQVVACTYNNMYQNL